MIPRRNLGRALKKAVAQPGYAFSAFIKRARSAWSYRRDDGVSYWPETISLFLTFQCNLRCKMCGQWGEHGTSKSMPKRLLQTKLSLEEIRALLDDVAGFTPTITLFGGEPFLHPDIIAVIQSIKERGMRCNMVSNCTLLEKHVDEVIDVGLDEIIFSLDGPREIHDAIRGREGIFDAASRSLKVLLARKQERKTRKPLININATIFEENYDRLHELAPVADELGAETITFHHLIFYHPRTCDQTDEIFQEHFGVTCPEWRGFADEKLPKIDVDELLSEFELLRQHHGRTSVTIYPNFTEQEVRDYYTNFEFTPTSYKNRCMSPWMVAYVFPDGSVRPCQIMGFTAGNIREKAFTEIWNDEPLRRYRQQVKERGHFPVCTRCTEFCRY